MKIIYLDCLKMTDKIIAHNYLLRMLSLPKYYGNNLDALYDCLTDLEPIIITFLNFYVLSNNHDYLQKIISVFQEAADANPNIQLIIHD